MAGINGQINQYIFTASNLDDLLCTQLNRAILFKNRKSVRAKVVFMNYDRDFHEKVESLEKMNGISLQSIFVNMYEFFRDYDVQNGANVINKSFEKLSPCRDHKRYKIYSEENNENDYLFFKNGMLVKRQTFDINGVLTFVRHYTNESLIKIEEYDYLGILIKSLIIEDDIVRYENFYRKDGTRFLVKRKRKNLEGELETHHIQLFSENDMEIFEFENEMNLWNYFLEIIIGEDPTLLTSDLIDQYPLVQSYNNINVYKALFIHNFDRNYDTEKDEILGMEIEELKEVNVPDAIVYSTDSQMNDVLTHYGKRENTFSVPPLGKLVESTSDLSEVVYRNKFVTALRDKDIVEVEVIIRAFRLVVDIVPEAELTIYGVQVLSDDINNLIKLLNLGNNVIVKSKEIDMNQIYHSVAGSIFIKEIENSEIQMIQSLKNGCPVISYDFNYEVNEIITNGENGYIVKSGSVRYLADAMVQLLDNPDVRQMREKSVLSSNRYNDTNFLKSWDSFISNLIVSR